MEPIYLGPNVGKWLRSIDAADKKRARIIQHARHVTKDSFWRTDLVSR